jgi:hypothetical protein
MNGSSKGGLTLLQLGDYWGLMSGFDNPYGMYGIRREYRAFSSFVGKTGIPFNFTFVATWQTGPPLMLKPQGKCQNPVHGSQLHAILQTGT